MSAVLRLPKVFYKNRYSGSNWVNGKLVKAHVPLSILVDILDRLQLSVSIWTGLLVPCMN